MSSDHTLPPRDRSGANIATPTHPHPLVTRRPQQLPLAGPAWVNRAAELAAFDRLADSPDTTRIVVSGMGGVGKTALAQHWMRRNGDSYPGGMLYVDLGGWSDQPSPAPEQVLAGWLRALRVPVSDEVRDLAELTGMFRTITADRSLAILVDNAAHAASVEPFLPTSPTSTVVVTSRRHLSRLLLRGFRPVRLDCLTTPDSTMLISELLPHHRDSPALTDLVDRCQGLPLAVSIVSGFLTVHTTHDPSGLLERLDTDPQTRLDLSLEEMSVRAVLDASYQQLTPDWAWVYRLCALHPGTEITAGPLAAATGSRSQSVIDSDLRGLADAHLLEETGAGRYRFHDLVRSHATALAHQHDTPEDRDQAQRRMIQWYLRRMAAADLTLNPKVPRFSPAFQAAPSLFADAASAGDWFAQERATILACQRIAHDRGWHDLVCQFAEAVWNALRRNDSMDTLLRTQQLGVDAARRWRETEQPPGGTSQEDHPVTAQLLEALCLIRVAYAETSLGRHDRAFAAATAAVDLAISIDDEWAQSAALSTRGRAHLAADNPQAALTDLRASLVLAERVDSPRSIALRHRRIGEALSHPAIADYPSAIDHLQYAGALMRSLGDASGNARVAISLAKALGHAGDPDRALVELTQVLEAVRADGSPRYLCDLYTALAEVHVTLGAIPEAHGWYTEAITLLEAAGRTASTRYRHVVTARDALGAVP